MRLLRKLCLGLLGIFGWTSDLVWPPEPRGIILVYPHTSNWDFIVGILFKVGHGLPANWVGKDAMFRWPFAGLLKRLGGIPINRRKSTGFIAALVEEYRRRDWLWIAIAPEGTRSHTDHFKSGFYQLSMTADIPVGLGYIDYAERKVAIDTYVRFTGDRERDIAMLREFYASKRGRIAANAGEIRLRD